MIDFDPSRPLDRCAGETRPAADALLDYYRMGSGRSLRALLERYRTQAGSEGDSIRPPTRRFSTLFGWSRNNDWQARIEAQSRLDKAAEDHAKAAAMAEAAARWAERRLTVRERDWAQAERLRQLADSILDEAPKFIKTTRKFIPGRPADGDRDGTPDREIITVAIDAKLMVGSLEAASKLQRLAAEMETEHTLAETLPAENIEEVRAKRWAAIQDQIAEALRDGPTAEQDPAGQEAEGPAQGIE